VIDSNLHHMFYRFRDIAYTKGPKWLYLLALFRLTPLPTGGYPGMISVKFCLVVNGWLRYQMA